MQLIRSVLALGSSRTEIVHLWKMFCRSVLEQSCVIWHSSLTKSNSEDLERTQKTFVKLVLKKQYKTYEEGLLALDLEKLSEHKTYLCLKFCKDGLKHGKLNDLFPLTNKIHEMETRNKQKFMKRFAHTERYKQSNVLFMQSLLNEQS